MSKDIPFKAALSGGIEPMLGIEVTQEFRQSLIEQINRLPGVLERLKTDQVHIMPLRLAGDALNTQGGRFRREDLELLLKLTNGAPLMVAHDTDTLPIGTLFGGEVVKCGEVHFMRPYAYWLTDAAGDRLKANIEAGITKEASISVSYKKPTCSICGGNIRKLSECEHYPLEEYDGELCFFWYDDLVRVWEGSLAFRGAHPGTGFDADERLVAALSQKAEEMKLQAGDKISKTDKNKKSGEIMEIKFTDEQGETLTAKLGIEGELTSEAVIEGVEKQSTELQTQKTAQEKADAMAGVGAKATEALREEVLSIDMKICGLSGKTQSETLTKLVAKSDFEYLQDLKAQKDEELADATPAFKCQSCGEKVEGLRVSLADSHSEETSQPHRRRDNPDNFKP